MHMCIHVCAYQKENKDTYHGERVIENEGGLGKISEKMILKQKAEQREGRSVHIFPSSRDVQHKSPEAEVEV